MDINFSLFTIFSLPDDAFHLKAQDYLALLENSQTANPCTNIVL